MLTEVLKLHGSKVITSNVATRYLIVVAEEKQHRRCNAIYRVAVHQRVNGTRMIYHPNNLGLVEIYGPYGNRQTRHSLPPSRLHITSSSSRGIRQFISTLLLHLIVAARGSPGINEHTHITTRGARKKEGTTSRSSRSFASSRRV